MIEKLTKKLTAYQGALQCVKQQIDREKEGLILDSGTCRPEIVNWPEIERLKKEALEYEAIIIELQTELRDLRAKELEDG